ncbi:hypothetical protein XELAEV_18015020mg [Xenopus laevis]|uniref:Uncharacterized protein n=1 Tax=Xenopus laevis TaxID=8355 RepID=A0A974DHL7_XENLA|nr:hypothetical protein XELAEV_18015020mg [Xenopus laevis]
MLHPSSMSAEWNSLLLPFGEQKRVFSSSYCSQWKYVGCALYMLFSQQLSVVCALSLGLCDEQNKCVCAHHRANDPQDIL